MQRLLATAMAVLLVLAVTSQVNEGRRIDCRKYFRAPRCRGIWAKRGEDHPLIPTPNSTRSSRLLPGILPKNHREKSIVSDEATNIDSDRGTRISDRNVNPLTKGRAGMAGLLKYMENRAKLARSQIPGAGSEEERERK